MNSITTKITPFLKQYQVKKAAIFGSFAKGTSKKNSDIDLLIQPSETMSLFDFIGLKLDLEEALDKKVDLVSYNGLSSHLKKSILNTQQIIYEL